MLSDELYIMNDLLKCGVESVETCITTTFLRSVLQHVCFPAILNAIHAIQFFPCKVGLSYIVSHSIQSPVGLHYSLFPSSLKPFHRYPFVQTSQCSSQPRIYLRIHYTLSISEYTHCTFGESVTCGDGHLLQADMEGVWIPSSTSHEYSQYLYSRGKGSSLSRFFSRAFWCCF